MASYLRQRCIRFFGLIWLCHQTHTACGGTKANEALLQILVGVGVNKLVSSLIVGNGKKLLKFIVRSFTSTCVMRRQFVPIAIEMEANTIKGRLDKN